MKATFDFKSALVGAIVTLALVVAVGAGNGTANSPPKARYQMQLNESNAIVIDTINGQTWHTPLIGGVPKTDFSNAKLNIQEEQ